MWASACTPHSFFSLRSWCSLWRKDWTKLSRQTLVPLNLVYSSVFRAYYFIWLIHHPWIHCLYNQRLHLQNLSFASASDNLNTHTPASLYAAFEPQEALRLCQRFEIHYTSKHGSWLNMTELEIGVLSWQCLNRRIADIETMECEVQAWVSRRNHQRGTVRWQFTTVDARIKLQHLYPRI